MTTFRNSIQDGTKFYCRCQKFHPMISWKACTNWEYVGLINSKTVLELCDMESHQKISVPNYQKLKTMVKRSIDQKLRLRNFDARHGRLESGAVIKSRKGVIDVEGGKRYLLPVERKRPVFAWRPFAVSATKPKIVRKNQNTLPRHLLSHEVEVCRGREVSEAKVTMGPFFDNPADIMWKAPARERLVNIDIRPSANSIKKDKVVRLETSVCFRIRRLMSNQKKTEKELLLQKEEKATTGMLWLLRNVYHKWGCLSQDSDELVSQGRKSRGNPMQKSVGTNSTGTIHSVYATSSKYPGKERTIVGKNKCQSSLSAKPLRYEIWERVPWRDWTTAAMCPKQGLEFCKTYIQTQRKRQGCIPLSLGGTGTPGCVNKRARGRRVCSWFRSEYAHGQWERP